MPPQIETLPLGPLQANCYLLTSTAPEAIAVDPGAEPERVLAALQRRQKRLTHILLTHAHFDHMGGVADLVEATGAGLGVHAAELPLLRREGDGREWGFKTRSSPEPGLLIEAGQVLAVGDLRLEALFVPGHTPGHLAFYLPEAHAVLTGDALFQEGIGRTDLIGGDYDTLLRSLREVLLALPDDTVVYPGHGPETTIGHEKRFNPFLAE